MVILDQNYVLDQQNFNGVEFKQVVEMVILPQASSLHHAPIIASPC